MDNRTKTEKDFATSVIGMFAEAETEIANRNETIRKLDEFIYGDRISKSLDIPVGHDSTSVNWLRRTVEIHRNVFMSRGFNIVSTYDSKDPEMVGSVIDSTNEEDKKKAEQEKARVKLENKKAKEFAEVRKRLIDAIIEDNGGYAFWAMLAESAGAVGDAALKGYYDEKQDKYVLSPIESIDNLRVLWAKDDFRSVQAYGFVYQITKSDAIRLYGVSQDVPTSPLGQPLVFKADSPQPTNVYTTQPMVTVFEGTGIFEGWGFENKEPKAVVPGQEQEANILIVGNKVVRCITEKGKMPHYYVLPNRQKRRRPWGVSDISDAAIDINLTYIETLSDWRTLSSKVNFAKYKAFGFGEDAQLPRNEARKVQVIPLTEGQDIQRLDTGDSNQLDFKAQLDECKEQFVRETGISRVLFDDPSVTLNSNQALLTSMKPTSDIAEAKKLLWSPIIVRIFQDALEAIAAHKKELADIINENYTLKVMWPSIMQKEDPVFQQMLLNRFNANTMSLQSYLEAQGETKEEIDRIRDEMSDGLTAAILGRVMNVLAQNLIAPPSDAPQVKTSINLRGDLTPGQEANHATQLGINDGPFPATMGPQGGQGLVAQENVDNQEFLTGNAYKGGQPIFRGPDGQPVALGQKSDTGTGQDVRPQVNTQANNTEGSGVVSQPGSGQATGASAQGTINQNVQQNGG